MAWNKNHFVLVADAINATRHDFVGQGDDTVDSWQEGGFEALDELAESLADKFEKLNPNFDRDRFLNKAGVVGGRAASVSD